jgi:hypothetical protein
MKYVDELLDKYEDKVGNIPSHYGKYQCRVIEPTMDEAIAIMQSE